jgi:hypothetical protein
MKFIPDALGRKLGESGLMASEKAPKLLFVGGVVGMVGSTVLACRATLKLSDTLDEIQHDLERAKATPEGLEKLQADPKTAEKYKDVTYDESDLKKDTTRIYIKGVGKITRLYGPAVLLGGVSIFALTKSHNLLQDRNLALTAAYAAVDTAYNRYRERVIDRYGEEVDREIRYETEQVDVVDEETGEIETKTRITDAPGSKFTRWYDEASSPNWSPDFEINKIVLRNAQHYANDLLRQRGHVWLNEIFTELGMSHTKEGAIVGWRFNRDDPTAKIDFGIFWTDAVANDQFVEAHNGREGAILLDFNVDGVILNEIEEED